MISETQCASFRRYSPQLLTLVPERDGEIWRQARRDGAPLPEPIPPPATPRLPPPQQPSRHLRRVRIRRLNLLLYPDDPVPFSSP
uniref:Uncharacterized protein n=1 Tax=Aegilops tauschii subsp. strangulata TaxID=200361 RepID=A0A453SRX6_AEGTS